jgi:hypothetical protein
MAQPWSAALVLLTTHPGHELRDWLPVGLTIALERAARRTHLYYALCYATG